jgi:hypothetical protein
VPCQCQRNVVSKSATSLVNSPFLPPQEGKEKESTVYALVANKTFKYVGSWIRRTQVRNQKWMVSTSITCVVGYSTILYFLLSSYHSPTVALVGSVHSPP